MWSAVYLLAHFLLFCVGSFFCLWRCGGVSPPHPPHQLVAAVFCCCPRLNSFESRVVQSTDMLVKLLFHMYNDTPNYCHCTLRPQSFSSCCPGKNNAILLYEYITSSISRHQQKTLNWAVLCVYVLRSHSPVYRTAIYITATTAPAVSGVRSRSTKTAAVYRAPSIGKLESPKYTAGSWVMALTYVWYDRVMWTCHTTNVQQQYWFTAVSSDFRVCVCSSH